MKPEQNSAAQSPRRKWDVYETANGFVIVPPGGDVTDPSTYLVAKSADELAGVFGRR